MLLLANTDSAVKTDGRGIGKLLVEILKSVIKIN